MRQAMTELILPNQGRGLWDFTSLIDSWLSTECIEAGVLTVFCRHTSASLLIQENAAAEVRSDLLAFFARIAPQDPTLYSHDEEGADDMPAHIRSSLTQVSLSIPIRGGQLALGTWQAVYLFEHRHRPQRRTVLLHAFGEERLLS